MENKKAILIGGIIIIFMITAAVFAVKIVKRNSSIASPVPVQAVKPAANLQTKAEADAPATVKKTEADSDVAAIENDLNSISDEDFSDSGLSDQAVGL